MQRLNKRIKFIHIYIKRIRYLKNILIAIVISLICWPVLSFFSVNKKHNNDYNEQNKLVDSKYKIQNFILRKSFDLSLEYKLFALNYTQFIENADIQKPILHIIKNTILSATINAQQGILINEKLLILKDKVQLLHQKKIGVFNEESEVDLQNNIITSDTSTKVTNEKSYFDSPKGFIVDLKQEKAKFLGPIKGIYYTIMNQKIIFNSEILEVLNKGKDISLEKNVLIIQDDNKLTSYKLLFDNIKNKAYLSGGVKLINSEEEVTSEDGYIDFITKKLYLTNNVVLKKQNATVKGKKFIYDYIKKESYITNDHKKNDRVKISINN